MKEKRYKLKSEAEHNYPFVGIEAGKLYSGNAKDIRVSLTVKDYAERYPEDWEVIEVDIEPMNNNEPTPTTLAEELEKEAEVLFPILSGMAMGEIHMIHIKRRFYVRGGQSPIAKRIHREGWMPVQWNDAEENPPKTRQSVLAINEYGRIFQTDWEEYTNHDLEWFKKSFISWIDEPSPNAPTSGYISIEEHERLMKIEKEKWKPNDNYEPREDRTGYGL